MSGVSIKALKQKRKAKAPYKQTPIQSTPLFSNSETTSTETIKLIPNNDLKYLKELTESLLYSTNNPSMISSEKKHILPSLTSANELDIRLYALFSLLLHNFVYGWYTESLELNNKDQFAEELVSLFAKICQNIQERINLRNQEDELLKFLIIDLPHILNNHLENIYNSILEIDDLDVSLKNYDFEQIWIAKYSDGLNDDETINSYRRVLVKGLVNILFPYYTTESRISKDFLISLIDGIVFKNIVESFSDSFVIWDMIGKISNKFSNPTTNIQLEKHKVANKKFMKFKMNKLYDCLIIEEKYQMSQENWFKYSDFSPFFKLLNFITLLNVRFPLVSAFFHVIFQVLFKIPILRKFINGYMKKFIFQNILTTQNLEMIVNLLRNMMFPLDDKFDMKPRYIPQNEQELEEIYVKNFKLLQIWLSSGASSSGIFAHNSNDIINIEKKIEFLFLVFKYKSINKILIQRIIDLLLLRIFPELESQTIIK
jgi:hypothetical protein